jgi:hypothetical protein
MRSDSSRPESRHRTWSAKNPQPGNSGWAVPFIVDQTCFKRLAQAFIPPSTVSFAPLMYEDSGPATNATIAAISSTCP